MGLDVTIIVITAIVVVVGFGWLAAWIDDRLK